LNIKKINTIANEVIDIQLSAIVNFRSTIDKKFDKIIEYLSKINGRIVVSGIGKSGIIGKKFSDTLNSTGTPSFFLHGSDALHGGLGAVKKGDIVICISKSGNNSETIELINSLIKKKIDIISMTANKQSYLANKSKFTIHTPIKKEACPNDLAPTTSTGIQLLSCDIISVCLMTLKKFDKKSFATLHPSGSLGKKLITKVKDLIDSKSIPAIQISSKFRDAINEISSKMLGATAVLDKNKIVGIITDGDVRRILEKHKDPLDLNLNKLIKKTPIVVDHNMLATDAIRLMNKNKITNLIVVKKNSYLGMLHIHAILKAGV
tara:strand:- start:2848 stop:3807 length:960 start_codon:yes stop_codon:yes gene_type:complete